MWFLRRRPLLDPDLQNWMFEHAEWLFTSHAHRSAFAAAKLLPISPQLFSLDGPGGHALAERLLTDVQIYAQVDHLLVSLVPEVTSGRFVPTGAGLAPQPLANPAGTYRVDEGRIEITYDTTLLEQPADLIAVLAHEIAHAILDLGADSPPPSEPAFDELLTDLTAVFCGFGYYQISLRHDTRVASPEIAHAWRDFFESYMGLREACFATALFAAAKSIPPRRVLAHLSGDAASHVRQAFRDIEERVEPLASLRMAFRMALSGNAPFGTA